MAQGPGCVVGRPHWAGPGGLGGLKAVRSAPRWTPNQRHACSASRVQVTPVRVRSFHPHIVSMVNAERHWSLTCEGSSCEHRIFKRARRGRSVAINGCRLECMQQAISIVATAGASSRQASAFLASCLKPDLRPQISGLGSLGFSPQPRGVGSGSGQCARMLAIVDRMVERLAPARAAGLPSSDRILVDGLA